MNGNDPRVDSIEDDLKEQRKTVTEQGQLIAVAIHTLGKIEEFMKELNDTQKELSITLTKFASHEEANNKEHQHLHNRIDKLELKYDDMKREHELSCNIVRPMAEKGANVHKSLVRMAWGLGSLVGLMLFSMVVWWVKVSDYVGK